MSQGQEEPFAPFEGADVLSTGRSQALSTDIQQPVQVLISQFVMPREAQQLGQVVLRDAAGRQFPIVDAEPLLPTDFPDDKIARVKVIVDQRGGQGLQPRPPLVQTGD